jgi:hypothetical protein
MYKLSCMYKLHRVIVNVALAVIGSYITNNITLRPMSTRQHRLTSAALLPWLSSYIASWQSHPDNAVVRMTRQHRRQYDSTMISRHGQYRLSNAIVNMTRQQHHTMDKSPRRYHANMTRQRLHTTVNIDSVAPSPAWLRGLTRTSPTSNPTQVHFYLHRRPQL